MTYLMLFLFGVGVGILGGLLGIGGGIALVPGLVLLFGFSQQEAQGTSLAVMIPPIGLFAAIVYYQNNYVRLPVVGWVALGFILGAFLGAKLVPNIPIAGLRIAFGLVLLYLGFMFVMSPQSGRPGAVFPAGVATLLAAILSRLYRRHRQSKLKDLPPPDDEIEYHI